MIGLDHAERSYSTYPSIEHSTRHFPFVTSRDVTNRSALQATPWFQLTRFNGKAPATAQGDVRATDSVKPETGKRQDTSDRTSRVQKQSRAKMKMKLGRTVGTRQPTVRLEPGSVVATA
jgi:hypothetical protein